tara:strand:+ start:670 stop:1065 length:396 start_codon:yes stop_codon:yes gene_type:complete
MIENKYILDALSTLKVNGCQLSGHPTKESEFLSMYSEKTGVDSTNTMILSSDPKDFSVTWKQVSEKAKEIEDAEPLQQLRQVRNNILAETDWMTFADSPTMSDAWKTYRQKLRDITKSATSLEDVTWPEKP